MLTKKQTVIENILNDAKVYQNMDEYTKEIFNDNYSWKGLIEDIDEELEFETMNLNKENVLILFNEYIY
jgi:CRISPR/Cas system-associated endonuclease Cas3-HD